MPARGSLDYRGRARVPYFAAGRGAALPEIVSWPFHAVNFTGNAVIFSRNERPPGLAIPWRSSPGPHNQGQGAVPRPLIASAWFQSVPDEPRVDLAMVVAGDVVGVFLALGTAVLGPRLVRTS
jgi:hypothetical protein